MEANRGTYKKTKSRLDLEANLEQIEALIDVSENWIQSSRIKHTLRYGKYNLP